MGSINLIVSCTKRKSVKVPSELQLRRFTHHTGAKKFNRWLKAITSSSASLIKAIDLYNGDHWSVVRDIYRLGSHMNGRRLNIWVCSAGYGLINIETQIKPYSATFSSDDIDSIGNGSNIDEVRDWWNRLTTSNISETSTPKSIQELMISFPEDKFLVCLSENYLNSVHEDLILGIDSVKDPENILIVSTGHKEMDIYSDYQIPSNATLANYLGGSLNSLNTRVARMMIKDLSDYPLRLTIQRQRMQQLLETMRPHSKPNRIRCSDTEVVRFIERELISDYNFSKSKLLRKLRDSGFACEQSRFSKLYLVVKSNRYKNSK